MKDLFYLRYSSEVPKDVLSGTLTGANLAYVAVPQLDPSSPTGNISIADRSFNFPENTTLFANNVIRFDANLGINNTNNILLTNKYSNTNDLVNLTPIDKTVPVTPLWYVYNFLTGFPLIPNPNGSYSVQLIDNNGNIASSNHILLDAPNQRLFTDLVNTTSLYYQVVYLSTTGQVFKLLSGQPYFTEVDSFSPGINNPEYISQYDSFLNQYQIRTQASPTITFSMLTIGTTKIHVTHPIEAEPIAPWYAQVTNGYFKRFVGHSTYEYGVPEYLTQPFNPIAPLQYQITETPIFLNNNLIQLRQSPLVNRGEIANDIVIYIRNSTMRSDQTNYLINAAGGQVDLTPEEGNTLSTIWYRLSIEDVDRTTGLVRINGVLAPDGSFINSIPNDNVVYQSDTLEAFYFYQELDLVFNKINLNPILNRALLTIGVSIYMMPVRSNVFSTATSTNTLYSNLATINYILFDENENILSASDPSVLSFVGTNIDSFFNTGDGTGIPLVFNDRTTFLELARLFVRNTATLRDITQTNLVDTRIEGGKLINSLSAQVIQAINDNTHGMYYLRDWNGIVLPGNSVVVIKVPTYLLNDTYLPTGTMLIGDDLTNRMLDIRRLCKKHLAAGVLPLVRFYDNTGIRNDLVPVLDRIYF